MITSIQAQFALSLTEVAQSQLRAQYYQQRISTGAWRERIGRCMLADYPNTVACQ